MNHYTKSGKREEVGNLGAVPCGGDMRLSPSKCFRLPLSTSSYTMYTCSLIIVYEKKRPNFFFIIVFFFYLYWRLLREKVCLTRVSKIFRTWKRIGYRRVKIIFFIIFLFLLEIGVKKIYFHKNWNSFNSNLSFIWKGKCK